MKGETVERTDEGRREKSKDGQTRGGGSRGVRRETDRRTGQMSDIQMDE